ncbi:YHS domain-containing protein [Photobacterium sp. BZF1]|uniref:YHS domain-containing (seleno)protein n=1 Tax=Photobacterium sp. BZF1 TaxID=1904457 RepID=UPI00165369D1|nr:YHS domain-containing (seleno)protein [Photobacterium sp. BZF1]MBC7005397.1 YHS domain-containing protein [Photobacterium sp. BZF1]
MTTYTSTLRSLSAVALLSFSMTALAADIDINADENDLAIKGYDPVAYFTEQQAKLGKSDYSATYKGATYHFASKDNQERFEANPTEYAPQYGGYCAFGVAMNKKFDTDPEAWKVVDGKLYLNLDKSVQKRWLEDTAGYIVSADSNWTNIKLVEADKL